MWKLYAFSYRFQISLRRESKYKSEFGMSLWNENITILISMTAEIYNCRNFIEYSGSYSRCLSL